MPTTTFGEPRLHRRLCLAGFLAWVVWASWAATGNGAVRQPRFADWVPITTVNAQDPAFERASDPDRRDRIRNDDGTETWFYRCQHRQPAELFPLLDRYKSPAGRINQYVEQNQLIIVDTPERLRFLSHLLRKLDTARPQVLLEIKVISLFYETDFQLGFETTYDLGGKSGNNTFFRGWEMTFNPDDFLRSLNANPPPVNANAAQIAAAKVAAQNEFQGSMIHLKAVGYTQSRIGAMDMMIRTLQGTNRASIVARPAVLVEQGYAARISAGQEVPIVSRTIVNNVDVLATEYKSVGVTLKLQPILIGTQSVRLNVQPEISSVSQFFNPGAGGLTNPIIQTAGANTTVTLHSGETLEIGGLRSTRSLISQSGIPFLMDIPIVGYLFRATNRETRRQDIVFFITPTILHDISDMTSPAFTQAVTSDYEYFGSGSGSNAGGNGAGRSEGSSNSGTATPDGGASGR